MALTYNQIKTLITNNTQPIVKRITKLRELFNEILDFANNNQYGDLDLAYDEAQTYGLLEPNKYVEFSSRLWKAKQDSFSGQAPPTDPNVSQNFYWEVISEVEVSGIKSWQAGLFGSGLIIVDYEGQLHKLSDSATRPFESTDFAAELANGDWEQYAPLYPVPSTATEISFEIPKDYGTDLSPLTGTLTATNLKAKKGNPQKIYHQDTSLVVPADWVLMGGIEYEPGVLNLIVVEWERNDRKIYWIAQEA